MNQDSNNLNQDNFPSQGNYVVPNNNTLNNQNMSINQSIVKPQNINYQQPKSEYMNTLENGNISYQNFNQKPQKNRNLGLIIGLIVAIVIGGIVLGIKFFSNDKNITNNSNNEVNNNSDTANNSTKKEEIANVTLDWATPILKVNDISALIPGTYELEDNIDNYDTYVAIVKTSTEINGELMDYITPETKTNNVILLGDGHDKIVAYGGKKIMFQPIYILAPKDMDISDIDITLSKYDDKTNTIYVKDNNVNPVSSGKAVLGDCLSFEVENIRYYMVLVDIGTSYSSMIDTPDYYRAISAIDSIIIRESSQVSSTSHNLFKAFSNDENITVVSDENSLNGSINVVASELFETQSSGILAFEGLFQLNNYYNKEHYDLTGTQWAVDNDKLSVKFLDSVEINFSEIYKQKNN